MGSGAQMGPGEGGERLRRGVFSEGLGGAEVAAAVAADLAGEAPPGADLEAEVAGMEAALLEFGSLRERIAHCQRQLSMISQQPGMHYPMKYDAWRLGFAK